MKIFFNFVPLALFLGGFYYGDNHKNWAAEAATQWLGFMVSGGIVGQAEAPILLATVVIFIATLVQILILKLLREKVDSLLWIGLVLITVLGGATVYFHNESFIKWKPSVLDWTMGGGLLFSQLVLKKNGLKTLLGEHMTLPDPVWSQVNLSWAALFVALGFANIWIAYNFSTSTWVNFKVFGSLAVMAVFFIAQMVYLFSKYTESDSKS